MELIQSKRTLCIECNSIRPSFCRTKGSYEVLSSKSKNWVKLADVFSQKRDTSNCTTGRASNRVFSAPANTKKSNPSVSILMKSGPGRPAELKKTSSVVDSTTIGRQSLPVFCAGTEGSAFAPPLLKKSNALAFNLGKGRVHHLNLGG